MFGNHFPLNKTIMISTFEVKNVVIWACLNQIGVRTCTPSARVRRRYSIKSMEGRTWGGTGPSPAAVMGEKTPERIWKMLQKSGGVGFTTVIVVQHSDEKHCASTFQWWTPLHLELWQTQNLLCFWRQEDQRLSKPNLHSKAVAFFGDPLLYV